MINNTTTSVLLTVLQTSMQQCDYLKEVIGEDNSFIEILLKRAVDIKRNLINYLKGPAHKSRMYWILYSHESYDVWGDLDTLPDDVFKNRFHLSRTQFGIL